MHIPGPDVGRNSGSQREWGGAIDPRIRLPDMQPHRSAVSALVSAATLHPATS